MLYFERLSLRIVRALVFGLLCAVGLAAYAQESAPKPDVAAPKFGQEVKTQVLEQMDKVLTRLAFVPGVDFSKWQEMESRNDKAIKESKTEAEFVTAVNQALRKFGFSHIVLYSPKFAEQRRNRKMVGLGVRIQIEEGGIRVTSVIAGSGAEKAGILPGDLIFEADGKKVSGPTDLTGDENTKVLVSVKREVEKQLKELKIAVVRLPFSTVVPESIAWPEKGIAVVKIPTFDVGYDKDNVAKVMTEALKAKSMVLDLRGNGGGQVRCLLDLAGYLLPNDNPLGTFVSRTMVDKYKKETGKPGDDVKAIAEWSDDKLRPMRHDIEPFSGRVAVLVDGGTGSASEMLAAALREHRASVLVGSKSAGAVLASVMMPVKPGYLLQFPVTDYVTIGGYRIEGAGLVPDIAAPVTRFGEKDKGVEEAIKWLKDPK